MGGKGIYQTSPAIFLRKNTMNKSFKFDSKMSGDILGAGLADAIVSALSGNGRQIDTADIKVADKGQSLDGFGNNILQAQSPALTKGMSYAIVAIVQVPQSINNRGQRINGYDGVALRDENGVISVVALTTLFNPWQQLLDEKGKIVPLEDLTSEGLRNQYLSNPSEYDKMTKFIKQHNNSDIANSFENGFTLQTSFEERFARLNNKIITIEDSVEVRVELTLTERAGQGMQGEKRPAVLRAYAFKTSDSADAIKTFEAKVKAGLAKGGDTNKANSEKPNKTGK